MEIQHETVIYYIEDALDEINKILAECKSKSLEDEDILVYMEHALHMLNFSYNARHLTRKETGELPQEDYDLKTLPPKDIFD